MSDLISRQAAIDALAKFVPYAICDESTESYTNGLTDAYNLICQLPSAQPEPKEGHWILRKSPDGDEQYECSECGVLWEFIDGTPEDNEAYFCPNCGAKMDEEIEGRKK